MADETIRYTSRTHEQIRNDLIALIPSLAPDLTSHGEDEPFIALVDMLAGVADGMHYYLDKQALENYFPTVKLRKNALRLAQLVGYRPRRVVAPSGLINIAVSQPLPYEIFIPAKTQTKTSGGLPITIEEEVYLAAGFSGTKVVPAYQGAMRAYTLTSPGGNDVTLTLPSKNPAEQLFSVTTYDEAWTEYREGEPEDETDRWYHYIEETDESVRVKFLGDIGTTPMSGTPIRVDYMVTNGTRIAASTDISTPDLQVPDGLTVAETADFETAVSYLTLSSQVLEGHRPKETVKQIRYTAPTSFHVRRRAVEEEDYVFLARQVPGVRDVRMAVSDFYTREVVAHVLGEDVSTVSQEVLDKVRDRLNVRNDLTLNVVAQAAGVDPFHCTVEVKAAGGYTDAAATFAAKEAIGDYLETTAVDFGRTLRIGEIYAIANRLKQVDYVNVTELYLDSEAAQLHDISPSDTESVLDIASNLTVTPIIA